MKTVLILAAALSAAITSAPAFAAPREAPAIPSVRVNYADLNLSDPRDAQVMLKRIRHAASLACSQSSDMVGNDSESIERSIACYRKTLAQAVAGLNAPKVTQAYGGQPTNRQVAGLR
jgi:UrcA family protein